MLSEAKFPPEPRTAGRRAIDNWRLMAPRWALLAALMGASAAAAFFYARSDAADTRAQIAAAEYPNKYTARLAERTASLETEVTTLRTAVGQLSEDMKLQRAVTVDLTTQIRFLTAELKKGR